MIRFEWEEKKNKINRKKHGVWFEEATQVFNDDNHILFFDHSHSNYENRYIIIGRDSRFRVVVVVHTYREEDTLVRLISARIATRAEKDDYEK